MDTHDHVVSEIVDAARRGGDVWQALAAQREHLAGCSQCRGQVLRLADSILGEDALLFLSLSNVEDAGALAEPPLYPRFSALVAAAPALWQRAGPTLAALTGDIKLRIKVSRQRMTASFDGLASAVAASLLPAPVAVPALVSRGSTGAGQSLTLPDPEHNVALVIRIEAAGRGAAHLTIQAVELTTNRPLSDVQMRLSSPDGGELVRSREGKAVFPSLAPGEYQVEIKDMAGSAAGGAAGHAWQISFTVE